MQLSTVCLSVSVWQGRDANHSTESGSVNTQPSATGIFRYPYSDLMLWACLLRRQPMAKFMWQMGDEALAKVHSLTWTTATFCVSLDYCNFVSLSFDHRHRIDKYLDTLVLLIF